MMITIARTTISIILVLLDSAPTAVPEMFPTLRNVPLGVSPIGDAA
jgi:hypothetical protein